MRVLIALFFCCLIKTSLAQAYHFLPKQQDEFSRSIVALVNSAAGQFIEYRGVASKTSFGDDQYLANKNLPGFTFGSIRLLFDKATCYYTHAGFATAAAAEEEMERLTTSILAAFGNNIRIQAKGKNLVWGSNGVNFQLYDKKGYFLTNLKLEQGYGMISFDAYDSNKKLLSKSYDFPMTHYIQLIVNGGVPLYFYSIPPDLPVMNKPLCEIVGRLMKESVNGFSVLRTNKRPHPLFSNTFIYDCNLVLDGWKISIEESSLGLDCKLEHTVTTAEYEYSMTDKASGKDLLKNLPALPGVPPPGRGLELLDELMEQLKPCFGESFQYSYIGKSNPAYSVTEIKGNFRSASAIVSFFESSFSNEKKLIITVSSKK